MSHTPISSKLVSSKIFRQRHNFLLATTFLSSGSSECFKLASCSSSCLAHILALSRFFLISTLMSSGLWVLIHWIASSVGSKIVLVSMGCLIWALSFKKVAGSR